MSLHKKWQKLWRKNRQENTLDKLKDKTKSKYDYWRAGVAAFTALSVFAGQTASIVSVAEAATVIERAGILRDQDGNLTIHPNGTINGVNGVYTVNPDKINGNNAFNTFNRFELDTGDIANMLFAKDGQTASNLFNFVQNRINIDGTVNAIKDNKIGGNLYFLSHNGMAIGKTGVINTGSLYVTTPTLTEMNKAYNFFGGGTASSGTLDDLAKAIQNKEIPLNNDGTITVNGAVNATNTIDLRAGKIEIGVDKDNVSVAVPTAKLTTGVVKFNALVNTGTSQSGLNGELTATVDANSGDIILKAISSDTFEGKSNTQDLIENFNPLQGIFDSATLKADAAVGKADSAASVIVGKGATIKAERNLEITADSQASVEIEAATETIAAGKKGGKGKKGNKPAAAMAAPIAVANSSSEATITILGNLEAGNDVNIASTSENLINVAAEHQSQNGDAAVTFALAVGNGKNNAAVDIQEGTIKGNNITIKAISNNSIDIEAKTRTANSGLTAAAAAVAKNDSSATVSINNTVEAKNNLSVESTNTITENTVVASSGMGTTFVSPKVDEAPAPGIIPDPIGDIQDAISGALDKTGKITGKVTQQLGKILGAKAAAAVSHAEETNTANIIIGGNGKLSADNIALNTAMQIDDLKMQAATDALATQSKGAKGSGSGGSASTPIGAAVQIADINDSSTITIADNATMKAQNGVTIQSNINMKYSRPENMVNDLKDKIAELKTWEHYSDEIGEALGLDNIISLYDSLENIALKMKTPDEALNADLDQDIMALANSAKGLQDSINKITGDPAGMAADTLAVLQSDVTDILDLCDAFTDVANYGNFSARSTANNSQAAGGSKSGSGGGALSSIASSIAGSVAIDNLNHTSAITIGKNVTIDAGNKDLTLAATNNTDSVNIAGSTSLGGKKGAAIGASYAYQNFDNKAIVEAAQGSNLVGKNILADAKNNMFNVTAAMNAGEGSGGVGNGLFTYTKGTGQAIVGIDDEVKLKALNTIHLGADNNTSITNVAAAISQTSGGSAVTLGVALNDYKVLTESSIGDRDDEDDKADTTNDTRGKVEAKSLQAEAVTRGTINAVGASGEVSGVSTGAFSTIDNVDNRLDNFKDTVENTDPSNMKKANKSISSLFSGKIATTMGQGNMTSSGISLDMIGSGAINLLENTTKASVDGVDIVLDQGNLDISAKNDAWTGAFAGEAALSFGKGKGSGSSTSLGLSGAVGLNQLKNNVEATVKNATIQDAQNVNVQALSGGEQVAAGLGIGAKTSAGSGSGESINAAGSASINVIDNDVSAGVEKTEIRTTIGKEKANIDVTAYNGDVQVTGAVQVSANQGKDTIGGIFTMNDVNNTINAQIKDSNVVDSNKTDVKALIGLTQVAAGAQANLSTQQNSIALTGSVLYNTINNMANSQIVNSTVNADETVKTATYDVSRKASDNDYQKKLGTDTRDELAEKYGVENDGKSYYQDTDMTEVNTTLAGEKTTAGAESGYDSGKTVDLSAEPKGALIVTAAANASLADNAAGAVVVINDIKNNFSSHIDSSTIKANDINTNASSDITLIDVAAGVAAGKGQFGGMGSVAWQTADNKVSAGIADSTLTGNVESAAKNDALMVTVAGSVGYGAQAGIGAALAYNGLTNTTESYLKGTTVNDGAISILANNDAKLVNVGASMGVSNGTAGIAGSIAVNEVQNTTSAVIDESDKTSEDGKKKRSTLNNVNQIEVNANDNSLIGTFAGAAGIGNSAGIGGAGTYNTIGSGKENPSVVKAALSHTDITSSSELPVDVAAINKSDIYGFAAGVGGASSVAVSGAVTTNIIDANVNAFMDDTNISDNKAKVNLSSENTGGIIDGAIVFSGADTAAIGAGVSVNQIRQNTMTNLSGGKQAVENLIAQATNKAKVVSFGVGGGVAGSGVAVNGSVVTNIIHNDTKALISNGADIMAENNVGVITQSDDQISNYVGSLTFGGIAAIGVSTSVNQIDGDTEAAITGDTTSVQAKGKDSSKTVTTNSSVKDDAIYDKAMEGEAFDFTQSLANKRTQNQDTGVVVDGSATHTLNSLIANGGISAGSNGFAAVNGTVNVNMIKGNTKAHIDGADINKDQLNVSDVTVRSNDYTNSAGVVGTMSAAVSGSAASVAVGAASDTNTIARTVAAEINGKKDKKSTVNADNLKVQANAAQGIASNALGVAAAAGLYGSAAAAGTVSVAKMTGQTSASINNVAGNVNDLNILADHQDIISVNGVAGGAGIYVGGGVSTVVVNEDSKTTADLNDSNIMFNSAGDAKIAADNNTTVNSYAFSGGVGIVGGAGSIEVNNLNGTVKTTVQNTTIGKSDGAANQVDILANNTANLKSVSGQLADGIAGIGVGVTVNTIDNTVISSVENSTIYANNNLNIGAKEIRDIDQYAANARSGGFAIGANIMVTTVGETVADQYTEDGMGGTVDLSKAYENANSSIDQGKIKDKDKNAQLYGAAASVDTNSLYSDASAKKSGVNQAVVKASIDNANLISKEQGIAVTANETTNVNMNSINASASMGSLNGTIGVLNVHRNSGIDVNHSTLDTKNPWFCRHYKMVQQRLIFIRDPFQPV